MTKSKKRRDQDGEDSDHDDDDDDLDDEEVSLGSMEEDFEDEIEDEGGEFMDVEEEDDDDTGAQPAKKKKKGKMEDQSVFASSEEFGCLLEENTSLKFDNSDMNAMANMDKADVKQLKWEVKRNDWIHGRDVKTLRRKKAMFNKRKFGKGKNLKSVKRKK